MSLHPSRRRAAGLTLVEVVISLGVLSVLVLGVVSSITTGIQHSTLAREHQAASEAAAAELDRAMSAPFSSIQNISASFDVFYSTGRVDSSGRPVMALLRPARSTFFPLATNTTNRPSAATEDALHIQSFPDPDANGSGDLTEIRVTVAWRSGDDRDYRVDLLSRRAAE